MEVEGESPVTLRVGESGHVPAKTVHEGKNGSDIFPVRNLVFGLTSEDEPLAVQVE